MRVFVTGVNGQLGHDVMNELARRGIEAGLSRSMWELWMEVRFALCPTWDWI